jgi:hypothetical protein
VQKRGRGRRGEKGSQNDETFSFHDIAKAAAAAAAEKEKLFENGVVEEERGEREMSRA